MMLTTEQRAGGGGGGGGEGGGVGRKWDEWLEDLEREMRFFRISDATNKEDAMLIYGGVEIRRLDKSLQDPCEGDVYTKLKGK